jgi:hypothetical protein
LPVEDPRRVDRIRSHTAQKVLDKIDRQTATRVFQVARLGSDAIVRRLEELDREWDIERWLALNFTIVNGLAAIPARHSTPWKIFFRAQQAFMVAHALVGWCPPTALFRRLGVRTQKEIDAERAVLVELLHLFADEDLPPLEIDEAEIEVVYAPATATSAGTAERW